MQRSEGLDNPQETRSRIAYFAGLFDGEGTITVGKMRRKGGGIHVKAIIQFVNTDTNMVQAYDAFLSDHGIRTHVQVQNRGKNADCYSVAVSHIQDMTIWLDLMTPFLIGKKAQALLLKKFVDSRLRRAWNTTAAKNRKFAPYNDEEMKVADAVRQLNRGSSETTRGPKPSVN